MGDSRTKITLKEIKKDYIKLLERFSKLPGAPLLIKMDYSDQQLAEELVRNEYVMGESSGKEFLFKGLNISGREYLQQLKKEEKQSKLLYKLWKWLFWAFLYVMGILTPKIIETIYNKIAE